MILIMKINYDKNYLVINSTLILLPIMKIILDENLFL